jgi:hypothetical protein
MSRDYRLYLDDIIEAIKTSWTSCPMHVCILYRSPVIKAWGTLQMVITQKPRSSFLIRM